MTNLAILGPGLIGGSIALAARARGGHRVAMWARRAEAISEIETRGVADRASTNLRAVVADADFVVLCVPIGAMPSLAKQVAELIPASALVTDVGSVKAPVCAALGPIFRESGRFVGSHPMAGSEQTGLAFARADLFESATAIVTPDDSSNVDAVAAVAGFWAALGSRVLQVSP
ncbi:MAG TPA: prephenate dehydrogenase/arogenate dehydrogenase family protein, partial [Chthoniobacteraceae bacterium]|nr:prephenate dehydrogenase/arogenate dehydrogenase family protein [Chthoniobacteraceae bacterium]